MEAVIFTGIQAAGKTSFYLANFFGDHLRLNLDTLKTRHREKIILDAYIESKTPFVVDNTNPTREDRQRYIVPAREAKFKLVGYYFDCRIGDALRRNALRQGKKCIPEAGIRRAAKRLEIPEIEEGFDELYIVKLNDAKGFTVEPL